MTDIVVRLELRGAAETEAFGAYLNRFVQDCADEVGRIADRLEAPFLMVRSEPQGAFDAELRVLTFQEPHAARDFTRGWRRERRPPEQTAVA